MKKITSRVLLITMFFSPLTNTNKAMENADKKVQEMPYRAVLPPIWENFILPKSGYVLHNTENLEFVSNGMHLAPSKKNDKKQIILSDDLAVSGMPTKKEYDELIDLIINEIIRITWKYFRPGPNKTSNGYSRNVKISARLSDSPRMLRCLKIWDKEINSIRPDCVLDYYMEMYCPQKWFESLFSNLLENQCIGVCKLYAAWVRKIMGAYGGYIGTIESHTNAVENPNYNNSDNDRVLLCYKDKGLIHLKVFDPYTVSMTVCRMLNEYYYTHNNKKQMLNINAIRDKLKTEKNYQTWVHLSAQQYMESRYYKGFDRIWIIEGSCIYCTWLDLKEFLGALKGQKNAFKCKKHGKEYPKFSLE